MSEINLQIVFLIAGLIITPTATYYLKRPRLAMYGGGYFVEGGHRISHAIFYVKNKSLIKQFFHTPGSTAENLKATILFPLVVNMKVNNKVSINKGWTSLPLNWQDTNIDGSNLHRTVASGQTAGFRLLTRDAKSSTFYIAGHRKCVINNNSQMVLIITDSRNLIERWIIEINIRGKQMRDVSIIYKKSGFITSLLKRLR